MAFQANQIRFRLRKSYGNLRSGSGDAAACLAHSGTLEAARAGKNQKVRPSSMWRHDKVLLARDFVQCLKLSHCFRIANMAPPIVTLQDMQQYWQACMSTVTATKTQPAHVSLLPCPPSQDPKAAGVTDEKFRVSAAEKQFLSSLELPFGVPVKGARNEKDMALRYRYFVRIGAGTVASAAAAAAASPEHDQPAPTAAVAAASAECERLKQQLRLEKLKNAANQKVS